jgi:hypothetical protein
MTLVITPFIPFELGETDLAQRAVQSYKKYDQTGEYAILRECFSNIHHLVNLNPSKKFVAIQACEALARTTIDLYQSIYVKFVIANFVCSIRDNAQLGVDPYWAAQCIVKMQLIKADGVDYKKAKEAGLRIEDSNSLAANGVVIDYSNSFEFEGILKVQHSRI